MHAGRVEGKDRAADVENICGGDEFAGEVIGAEVNRAVPAAELVEAECDEVGGRSEVGAVGSPEGEVNFGGVIQMAIDYAGDAVEAAGGVVFAELDGDGGFGA
jgi:hypothetical protein